MQNTKIYFFNENVNFTLPNKMKIKYWIRKVLETEKTQIDSLNIIFCDDEYLQKINIQYLHKHTLTDIICFPLEEQDELTGEMYISTSRVKENAKTYQVVFNNELNRVIIHGVLHLCGYTDSNAKEKTQMREKENYYLGLLE